MSWAGLDDFLARVSDRLDPATGEAQLQDHGDTSFLTAEEKLAIRPAAVLIGILPRKSGPTALLTLRPDTMSTHAGQVAFPGGKIDPGDADEVAAALREAQEEVGLPPEDVQVLGRSAPYVTGTSFRITPVVGLLPMDFEPLPAPEEVADVFETPLEFLMNIANHQVGEAVFRGQARQFYEMPHGGFHIWGVTAGIIRRLYNILYDD